MSVEHDKPGFIYPPIARGYGFMGNVNTMQELPTCECQSLSNGFSTGVGIAAGTAVVAGVAFGLWRLLRK